MQYAVNAVFEKPEIGIEAAWALLFDGVKAEDIHLVLPYSQLLAASLQSGNALSASKLESIPSQKPQLPSEGYHIAVIDAGEGAGIGVGLGLLTALCIPGIGMFVGSAALIAGLMTGGMVAGSIAGGIYGYLTVLGVSHGLAQIMHDHVEAGGTILSVAVHDAHHEAEIAGMLQEYGGQLIQ